MSTTTTTGPGVPTESGPATPAGAAPAAPVVPVRLLTASLPTPAGDLHVVADDDGVVRAAGYGPAADLHARTRVVLGVADLRPVAPDALPGGLVDAVARYADGDTGALDVVAVQQPGGPFFQALWVAMRAIPPGATVTYAELAAAAGRPRAIRAAGQGCARNLVAPFVPCHRVVRTDGTLGGYAYGLDAKRALLAHERRVAADRPR